MLFLMLVLGQDTGTTGTDGTTGMVGMTGTLGMTGTMLVGTELEEEMELED